MYLAVRNHYTTAFFVELDHLEVSGIASFQLASIFFGHMTTWQEGFNPDILELNSSSTVNNFQYTAFQYASFFHQSSVSVPWVVFHLLVAEAELAVFHINLQYGHFHQAAHRGKFTGVLDFLGPAEIRDVNKSVDAFFQFHKYTEVGKVANGAFVTAVHRILRGNVCPWIRCKLLHAE